MNEPFWRFSISNLLVPYYHYLLLKGTLSLKNGLILDYLNKCALLAVITGYCSASTIRAKQAKQALRRERD